MPSRLAIVAALLLACTGSAPSPEAAPVTKPKHEIAPALMQALVDRPMTWSEIVDRERGLTLVEYYIDSQGNDPRADAQGLVARSVHACGDELVREIGKLGVALQHLQPESSRQSLFTCERNTCSYPAQWEYARAGTYHFVKEASGPRLAAVVLIEGSMAPAFYEAAATFESQARERFRDARCP